MKAVQVERECIDRLQRLYGGSVVIDTRARDHGTRKPQFEWRLTGERAILLMQEIKPLMSERRQAQIGAVVEYWLSEWQPHLTAGSN